MGVVDHAKALEPSTKVWGGPPYIKGERDYRGGTKITSYHTQGRGGVQNPPDLRAEQPNNNAMRAYGF